jgi:hypothetical protein
MREFYVILAMVIGCLINPTNAAETGPSASDVKAAMVQSGIRAGASFQLGDRVYSLHNISVSKTGPESFVVSFVTK